MAIKSDEDEETSGWGHMGDKVLVRFPGPAGSDEADGVEQVILVSREGITTTGSLNARQYANCEVCDQLILSTDFPTPGTKFDRLRCGECSAAADQPSLVSRAAPRVGRPRKVRER